MCIVNKSNSNKLQIISMEIFKTKNSLKMDRRRKEHFSNNRLLYKMLNIQTNKKQTVG